jgi:hypothetical protein
MPPFIVIGGLICVLVVLMIRALSKPGGRSVRRGPGPGASGAIYDMLNEDKRKAIEIIVEGRAEYRDPEAQDDVPDDDETDTGSRPRAAGRQP